MIAASPRARGFDAARYLDELHDADLVRTNGKVTRRTDSDGVSPRPGAASR